MMSDRQGNVNRILPLIAMRGLVVFPYMMVHFDIGREKSVKALEAAMAGDQMIFLVAQRDTEIEEPDRQDMYDIGTVTKIKQVLRLPGDSIRVLAEGVNRARLLDIVEDDVYLSCVAEDIADDALVDDTTRHAVLRQLKEVLERYFSFNSRISAEAISSMMEMDNPAQLADVTIANLNLDYTVRQRLLSGTDIIQRVTDLIAILHNEIEIIKAEQDISEKVKSAIVSNQREYYLREQLKAISDELGGKDGLGAEIKEYKEKIAIANLPEEVAQKLAKETERLSKMPYGTPEGSVVRNYLDCVLELPWHNKSKERFNIHKAEQILDADHYGLEKVKERVLEYLSVRKLSKGMHGPILCFVGPPGVGKTSVAKSVAKALGRKYVRISLGGIHDEADIRGHRKTYIGSMPGRIMNAMRLAGTKNPLMLLDEIDKMSHDFRGDPASAMLEVLDAEQNFAFRDHYLELPFDLSGVLFITTANTLDTVSPALLDRMEVISISGYTQEEKLNIAKRYLLPKQFKNHGLTPEQLLIDDEAIEDVINYYTRESGVRNLERELANICRKAARAMIGEKKHSITITPLLLQKYLGVKKYRYEMAGKTDEVGVARGLAWTSSGGDTLSIEVNVMPGSGKIELTGHLGDVMKESAKTAISYIRSKATILGIREDFYKTLDIHIHVPEGAVPKDGPSAGIAIAAALVSALSGYSIRHNVALTGEITLRGRVLPIGGLKEKSLAAYRAGISTVIIPEENKRDLDEIPKNIKECIDFVTVGSMEKVLELALTKNKQPLFELPVSKAEIKTDIIPMAYNSDKAQVQITQ